MKSRTSSSIKIIFLIVLATGSIHYYCFSGFGLGDDVNEVITAINVTMGGLDPNDFFHYRLMTVLPRALSFYLLGVSEWSFLLPIFIFSIIVQILSFVLARDLFGNRGGFICASFFFFTPFEALCATANIPDYITASMALGCAICALRGLRSESRRWMILAAVFVLLGIMNRMAGILVLAPLGVATLFSLEKRREWITLWVSTLICFGLFSVWDWHFSGEPLRWLYFNSMLPGHDVTEVLSSVLWIYPNYLFFWDDFGNFMFGASAWIGAFGFVVALILWFSKRESTQVEAFLLLLVLYVLLVEFVPHRFSFSRYYSHPRIFRYLAQIAPAFYILGAYILDLTWDKFRFGWISPSRVALLGIAVFGFSQIPAVTFPSRDANTDFRAIRDFLDSNVVPAGSRIQADFWDIGATFPLLYPKRMQWVEDGMIGDDPEIQKRFLDNVKPGILITGGAFVAWYSNIKMNLDLTPLNYTIPPNWKLLMQRDASVTRWRREPLRIWQVDPKSESQTTHTDQSS